MPPLEERVEYPYQNIRTKNFPWGNGDKTLLYVALVFLLSPATRFSPWEISAVFREAQPLIRCANSWNDNVNYHNRDKAT